MNITELIEELEHLKKVHGDLPIHVWADHGQKCTSAWACGIQYVDGDGDSVAEEDFNNLEEDFNNPEEELCKDDYTLIVEISG